MLYLQSKHPKSSKYSTHLKKCTISAALWVYNVNSQCTVKNFQKKKKTIFFSCKVLNLVAACFNN